MSQRLVIIIQRLPCVLEAEQEGTVSRLEKKQQSKQTSKQHISLKYRRLIKCRSLASAVALGNVVKAIGISKE
jgi:hypothetical protein